MYTYMKYIYIDIDIYINVCVYICTYTKIYMKRYMYTYIYISLYTNRYTYAYIHIYIYMYVYIDTYVHVYKLIQKHIHTCTCIHDYTSARSSTHISHPKSALALANTAGFGLMYMNTQNHVCIWYTFMDTPPHIYPHIFTYILPHMSTYILPHMFFTHDSPWLQRVLPGLI